MDMATISSKSVDPWKAAHIQAKRIGKAKTKAGKRKQIVAWCEMVKKAMRPSRG